MKSARGYGNMFFRETLYSLLICEIWARDQKEVTNMNKYELAVVVSAKIEDDERAAVVDKCKALVERFGGNRSGRVGQEEACLRSSEDERSFLLLHQIRS